MLEMDFLALLMRFLENYWTEFRQTFSIDACILGQGWTPQFMGSKGQSSRSQHDRVPSGQKHTELDTPAELQQKIAHSRIRRVSFSKNVEDAWVTKVSSGTKEWAAEKNIRHTLCWWGIYQPECSCLYCRPKRYDQLIQNPRGTAEYAHRQYRWLQEHPPPVVSKQFNL